MGDVLLDHGRVDQLFYLSVMADDEGGSLLDAVAVHQIPVLRYIAYLIGKTGLVQLALGNFAVGTGLRGEEEQSVLLGRGSGPRGVGCFFLLPVAQARPSR